MSPVIPFRRRSRYPRVPFALGVLAAIALGAAAIAAWMIWQRSSVSPSGQIIEVIDGDTVRLNGAVYRLVGFDTPERGRRAVTMNADALKRPPHASGASLPAVMLV
jgi:endonuclease YncB( thermonuclease family)